MAATDFHSQGGKVQSDVWELTGPACLPSQNLGLLSHLCFLTHSSNWIGSWAGGGSETVTAASSIGDAASIGFAPPAPTKRTDDMWLRVFFSRVTKNGPLFRSIISNIRGRPTMTAAAHSSGRLL